MIARPGLRTLAYVGVALLACAAQPPGTAEAQTDFYNLDHGSPLRVEDAYATKQWAFEVQASPFALSQERDGPLRFTPSLELKHGLLPGLEISAGTEIEAVREDSESDTALGDIELSGLLNLWIESGRIPALGVRVTSRTPTESVRSGSWEGTAALTRGLGGRVRAHVNAGLMAGPGREEDWWAGGALDYVLPFQHTLVLAETWVSAPRAGRERVHSAVGVRLQLTPTVTADAGVGRSWAGHGREDWAVTVGLAHEFGIRALVPGAGQ